MAGFFKEPGLTATEHSLQDWPPVEGDDVVGTRRCLPSIFSLRVTRGGPDCASIPADRARGGVLLRHRHPSRL